MRTSANFPFTISSSQAWLGQARLGLARPGQVWPDEDQPPAKGMALPCPWQGRSLVAVVVLVPLIKFF